MFDWLSRDEAVVSLYQSDEKCNFVFTATGFRDLFTLITKANNPVTFRKTPRTCRCCSSRVIRTRLGGTVRVCAVRSICIAAAA